MNDWNDGVLVLLQDIKQILFGIFLFLTGGFLTTLGLLLGGWFALVLFVSVPLLLSGGLYVWNGWRVHEVSENQN